METENSRKQLAFILAERVAMCSALASDFMERHGATLEDKLSWGDMVDLTSATETLRRVAADSTGYHTQAMTCIHETGVILERRLEAEPDEYGFVRPFLTTLWEQHDDAYNICHRIARMDLEAGRPISFGEWFTPDWFRQLRKAHEAQN